MIDFIKTNLTTQKDIILENPLLDFEVPINVVTGEFLPLRNKNGEIIYKSNGMPYPQASIAKYKNLVFKHKPSGQLELSGSLHKFCNIITRNVNQNYDDFTFDKLTYTLNKLKETFNIELSSTFLVRFEFGVNIRLPIDTKQFINERIIEYSGKGPTETKENFFDEFGLKSKGFLKGFERSKFKIKIYDKALQYGLIGENILRFEVNSNAKYFQKKVTHRLCLEDFYDKQILRKLGDNLIDQSYKILLRDTIPENVLEEDERELVVSMRDPVVRNALKQTDRFKFRRRLKKYLKLCQSYDAYSTENFSEQIRVKVSQLIGEGRDIAQISTRIGDICASLLK